MNIQKFLLISFLFLSVTAQAKTIQVGGEPTRSQEQTAPCWNTSAQPIIFINGLQTGQQPNLTLAMRLTANAGGSVCGGCPPAGKVLTSTEKAAEKNQNEKPVMVWYKEPKTNKKIIVNGKHNDLDEEGNLQWQKIHARNHDCSQGQHLQLRNPCNCIVTPGAYVPLNGEN